MIKKLLAILFCLLFVLALTACHGSQGLDPFETPEEFDLALRIPSWSAQTRVVLNREEDVPVTPGITSISMEASRSIIQQPIPPQTSCFT